MEPTTRKILKILFMDFIIYIVIEKMIDLFKNQKTNKFMEMLLPFA